MYMTQNITENFNRSLVENIAQPPSMMQRVDISGMWAFLLHQHYILLAAAYSTHCPYQAIGDRGANACSPAIHAEIEQRGLPSGEMGMWLLEFLLLKMREDLCSS